MKLRGNIILQHSIATSVRSSNKSRKTFLTRSAMYPQNADCTQRSDRIC